MYSLTLTERGEIIFAEVVESKFQPELPNKWNGLFMKLEYKNQSCSNKHEQSKKEYS